MKKNLDDLKINKNGYEFFRFKLATSYKESSGGSKGLCARF